MMLNDDVLRVESKKSPQANLRESFGGFRKKILTFDRFKNTKNPWQPSESAIGPSNGVNEPVFYFN